MKKFIPLFLLLVLVQMACVDTQKVLKSTNTRYKYTVAMNWYNKGKYFQAIPVLENLISAYKGTDTAEELYYTLAQAYYKNEEYLIAAYHFKNYRDLYPYNAKAEDALYFNSLCYYYESPRYSLDQTETQNAIENLQLFVNEYPNSARIAECNVYMSKLRRKLEIKAYEAAKLYYRTMNYRAAGVTFRNLLIEFPDIAEAEECAYLAIKSDYIFAEKSITPKQPERYYTTSQNTQAFYSRYPNSKYLPEIQEIEEKSYLYTIKSAYEWGQSAFYDKRIEGFNLAIENYRDQFEHLKLEKNKVEANEILEKSFFHIVKTNYDLAEELKEKSDQIQRYEMTIKAYMTFIEKYPTKITKELENMYLKSSERLKKLNTNQS